MSRRTIRHTLFEGSRGRIVDRLRHGEQTVDELATALQLTDNAIRAQLTAMERDGLVTRGALRPGTTRPSQVYELTPQVELLLSRAYIPLLTHLIHAFSIREDAATVQRMMRETGRGLARELAPRLTAGTPEERVRAASALLNAELGALTSVHPEDGSFIIRGSACPLSALTGKHRSVCLAVETMLSELLAMRVRECCDRDERPRCCFAIRP